MPNYRTTLTADRARELLAYDPETGVLTWRVERSTNLARAGDVAGCQHWTGYFQVSVDGKRYLNHRLIWLIVTGAWPKAEIDHINGVRTDNRLCNLREASKSQNMRNKASRNRHGFKGVVYAKRDKRWIAGINIDGKRRYIGTYDSPEEAGAAYAEAAQRHHGEFANTKVKA